MQPQTKVFVGSLPQGSKPEELRRLFERFGEVTECDIMNRCGFIHMATEEEAAAAIRALNNASFNGSLITVEKGRIKERGSRGPGGPPRGPGGPGPMRGGMRNGMGGGGPMRGPPMGGVREPAPYMRDSRPPMRGMPMGGGMGGGMRNGMGGGGYDAYPEDRFNGYGAEDRRGYPMMDRGGRGDIYASGRDLGYAAQAGGAGLYPDERRGGGSYGGLDDRAPIYPDERRAPLYPDELMERRASGMRPPMSMAPGYDRGPAAAYDRGPAPSYDRGPAPRPAAMGNGDMFSRRSPPPMRSAGGGGYPDRDPYAPQYPSAMGRVGGGAGPRGGRDMGMGPRRY